MRREVRREERRREKLSQEGQTLARDEGVKELY
jgi:hypothetical protein